MLEHALLYFIPSQGRDDIAEGYTDYVIWNRFRPECLDIDGDLPMECVDSGMLLLKGDPGQGRNDIHWKNKKSPGLNPG